MNSNNFNKFINDNSFNYHSTREISPDQLIKHEFEYSPSSVNKNIFHKEYNENSSAKEDMNIVGKLHFILRFI